MSDDAQVIRLDGDFTDYELAAVAASFAHCDAGQVCAVAMVVTLHPAAGEHEVRVATTIEDNPSGVASLLRHAADHVHGGCKPCRTRNARRNRHAN